MQKITPCQWFDSQAEEAVRFYTSIIKNSKMGTITRYDDETAMAARMPVGSVMTVTFQIEGQEFLALNGGPIFQFTPAVSFIINCDNQTEIDTYWEKLSEGGMQDQCGWLKDKYGLSWQVVPRVMEEMLSSKDPEKTKRVMKAMMPMKKLDIKTLQEAYEGVPSNVRS